MSKVFWLERALAEPTGLANHHFMTNALRCLQVVGLGRINKDKMGNASVNQLLVVFRQAKQRLQGPRKAAVKSRPLAPLAQPVPFAPQPSFEAPKPKWAAQAVQVLDDAVDDPEPRVPKAPPVQAQLARPKVPPSAAPKAPSVRTVPPPVKRQPFVGQFQPIRRIPIRRVPMYQRPRPVVAGLVEAVSPKVVPPPPKQASATEATFQEVSRGERPEISCEESLRFATAKACGSPRGS